MGNEPRVAVIIAKRESAEQYLTTARDMLTLGNYAFARVKAKDAFDKVNESYNDGVKLKKRTRGRHWRWQKLVYPGYDLHYYRNCCCDNSNCGLSFPAAKEPMGRLLISRYSIFQDDLKICFTGKSKNLIKIL